MGQNANPDISDDIADLDVAPLVLREDGADVVPVAPEVFLGDTRPIPGLSESIPHGRAPTRGARGVVDDMADLCSSRLEDMWYRRNPSPSPRGTGDAPVRSRDEYAAIRRMQQAKVAQRDQSRIKSMTRKVQAFAEAAGIETRSPLREQRHLRVITEPDDAVVFLGWLLESDFNCARRSDRASAGTGLLAACCEVDLAQARR